MIKHVEGEPLFEKAQRWLNDLKGNKVTNLELENNYEQGVVTLSVSFGNVNPNSLKEKECEKKPEKVENVPDSLKELVKNRLVYVSDSLQSHKEEEKSLMHRIEKCRLRQREIQKDIEALKPYAD